MAGSRRLEELVSAAIAVADFPEGPLLVALSGGPDSAGLAYLAARSGHAMRCLHVDHGLEESGMLRDAAIEIAGALGVPCHTVEVEVGGAFSEERGRKARYQALSTDRQEGEWIVTGHTFDDQAETVVLNLVRGSGPRGLTGIPARRGHIARPLLEVRRHQLREIAVLAGLAFVDDPMNVDQSYARNAIRFSVFPLIEASLNPRFSEAVVRAAKLVASDDRFLDEMAEAINIHPVTNGVRVARSDLLVAPRPVADRVMRDLVVRLRPPHAPSFEEMESLWGVASGSQRRAQLAGGLEAAVDRSWFTLTSGEKAPPDDPGRVILSPGRHRIGGLVLEASEFSGVCRVLPLGVTSAVFPLESEPVAVTRPDGRVVVEIGDEEAWVPGHRRFPVAFYEPGTTGYLSVFATEEDEWTSSP